MTSARLMLLGGVAALLLPLLAQAQGADSLTAVDQRSFTRDFGGRQVACDLTARTGGLLAPGKRVVVQLDFDSAISGGNAGDFSSAVVINGLAAIALPPGLEPDGQLRLFFYDEAKGSYQFMYSKDFPKLERLTPVAALLTQPAGGDPKAVFASLADISRALDPAVTPRAPADSRVIGGNASYAVSGISWFIPCSVLFDELVNPFDPADSLGPGAKIRVNIPLKVTGEVANPRVALYAGGLSCAVAQEDLPADKLPATAIPLAPLPAPAETAAQAPPQEQQQPAAGEEQAATQRTENRPAGRSGTGRSAGDGRNTPVERPEGQDEEQPAAVKPDTAAAAPAAPAPPAMIPCLVYSYEWVAWETEIDLGQLAPATPEPQLRFEDQPQAPEAQAGTLDTTSTAPASAAQEHPSPALHPGSGQQRKTEAGQPALQEDTSVREVAPDSVPAAVQNHSVPLKEITGGGTSASGTAPQPGADTDGPPDTVADTAPEDYTPPADLGEMVLIPEGYFLMGTGGSASAGDPDEMPQTQVYLPAYYIDKYPVTNQQFMEFVLKAGYKPEGKWDKYYSPTSKGMPVREVTWNDANAYARWAGKRLPTEAEWEKAARGEDGRTYPWGEEWTAEILPRGEMIHQLITAPAAASPYGVMAMCGVLWQWTASQYAPYPFDPNARGEKYVLRGGCYSNGRNMLRCANRYAEPPNIGFNTFSFRCVKDSS